MRKAISCAGIAVLLLIVGCHNTDKRLVGVWQLQELSINGTNLQGSSLGNWLWEFNDAGGYLTEVAGVKEKGVYSLKDSTLSLKLAVAKNGADQVYKITKLSAEELNLLSTDPQNKQTMRFVKRKVSDVTGDKD